MKNRKIYTLGETVLDLFFKDGQPTAARPGGSMLNSSVSLGRLGLPVHLITEIGRDDVGDQIFDFLNLNKVGSEYIDHFEDGNTCLALAFLDEHENARYSFYKNYPANRLKVNFPVVSSDDIVLFGSAFAVSTAVRVQLKSFLISAKQAGAIVLYDPNFRTTPASKLQETRKYIKENIEFADIIRGSNDDFMSIFDTHSTDDIFKKLSNSGNKMLICTNGGKRVCFRSSFLSFPVDVPTVNPVSTVGAGDSFNAGLVYSLYKLNVRKQDLPCLKIEEWKAILETGIAFGSIVCESYDNYIPEEFGRKLPGWK